MAETDHARLTVAVLCFGGLTASLTQTSSSDPVRAAAPAQHLAGQRHVGRDDHAAGRCVSMPIAAGSPTCSVSSGSRSAPRSSSSASWSARCRLAGAVLAGRALQGAAMGFIRVAISLMREVVTPPSATTAIAAMSATLGVGGAIGLPLSAWIVDRSTGTSCSGSPPGWPYWWALPDRFAVPHVRDGDGGHVRRTRCRRTGGRAARSASSASPRQRRGAGPTVRTMGCIAVASSSCSRGAPTSCARGEPLVDLGSRPPSVLFTNVAPSRWVSG